MNFAALRRNTCRFLLSVVGKITIPMVNSEERLAAIPNEEAIHCRHLGDSEHL
jgi:hypothetical protein